MRRAATMTGFALLFGVLWWCLAAGAASTDSSLSSTGRVQTAQEPISPRLAALRKALENGDRAALEKFWQEAAAQGAPIIEPIQGDDRAMLVTFLWRAKEETRNVLVFAGLGGGTIAKNQMTRLMDTDVWYKTYRVPRDSRFTYTLSPNDSLVPIEDVDEKDIAKRFSTFRRDPLNKRDSIVELPGAPPSTWGLLQPEVPK